MADSTLQSITANRRGSIRREVRAGREYLVAPVSMIVPGVLNGSKGALLYPLAEIEASAELWNGVPIVIDHPVRNGVPLSARDPDVLERQGVGYVYKARSNGKLVAEAWFDAERVRNVSPKVHQALVNGSPMELSTGLYTENEPAKGVYQGKAYDYVARNYRPDHLAVLPGDVGACSLKDGCGVLVNKECGRDCDCEKCKAKRKEPEMKSNREEVISGLIANCGCFDEADRETLNRFGDEKLTVLAEKLAKKEEEKEEEEEEEEGPKFKEKDSVENVLSDEEWLAKAPPRIRSVVANALRIEASQRKQLVDRITSNSRNRFTREYLETKQLDELEALAELADSSGGCSYLGAAVPTRNVLAEDEDDMLPLPTMNWSKK